jgi:hypothetical protein
MKNEYPDQLNQNPIHFNQSNKIQNQHYMNRNTPNQ